MQRAVLFDLDETLSDRNVSVRRMVDVFADRFGDGLNGCGWDALYAAIVDADDRGYRPRDQMAEQLCARLPWERAPEPAEIVELWRVWIGKLAEPMPGLHDTLESLRAGGFRLGVITNGPLAGQNQKIDTLGIRGLLDVIVTSEEARCAKPDPKIFAQALEALSVDASSSWFVGDNPVADVSGAEGAGLRAVWIRGGAPWPDELPRPRYSIQRLEQLLDLVR